MKKLKVILLLAVAALLLGGINTASAQTDETLKEWLEKRFDQIDTDKDGKLSLDEFMSFQKGRFKAVDADGDGYLTEDELREAGKKKGQTWREKRKERRSGSQ